MRILPALTFENEFFWASGADGRLQVMSCTRCAFLVHPPAPVCPDCWSRSLEPMTVSGRGVVVTFTINHHRWMPEFDPPYVVALVGLDEDPRVRIVTNIVGCAPEEVTAGMPVQVCFEHQEDVWIPLFEPVAT